MTEGIGGEVGVFVALELQRMILMVLPSTSTVVVSRDVVAGDLRFAAWMILSS